jgi:phage shock protein A
MVKIEGTLDELRALLGRAERATADVVETVKEVKTTAKKTRRKLSEWQRYVKRGPKKGRLDLASMSKAFKRRSK